ncbi:helix-turn-helix domain-containing protein [Nakamurella multipartita]|uniref:Uncharacterized protein n=1 Tax=Nakamurella multipartita (strain ATCC 700099 / DSM 44233 / CIP 104796 / JCM 9543 / NBRC 105858 / Y-104) TaxID=479431 RepID=C8X663_NAKMY|nr:helix-turn-helix domain-containing protein [Nakamurella multipartita]ACV76834.1 hypothetical protein Namu_0412 [Nakamurella multipartita DSM 44233]
MALHSVDGPADAASGSGIDVDAEAGFFEMSPAGAEQVTMQIRSMMERAWEYIAIAYQGRAHIALGYETWDQYVDDRLGDLRLTVPREERGAVVQSLSRAQMSLRAIAKVLGVDPATVHRALGADDSAGADDAEELAPVRGRDGKTYPRRRRQRVASACSICGELHDESLDECPWDLFAQGLGPRPVWRGAGLEGPSHDRKGADVMVEEPPEEIEGLAADGHPAVGAMDAFPVVTIVDSVTRAVCLVEELDTLPQLVDEIEVAGATAGAGLVDVIRELTRHLRAQAATMVALVGRLERLTPPL